MPECCRTGADPDCSAADYQDRGEIRQCPSSSGSPGRSPSERAPSRVCWASCCPADRRPRARAASRPTDFSIRNRILERRGILDRKGFPESYDQEAMLRFLTAARAGRQVRVPVYSHEHYDVVPGRSVTVGREDILIVEGLNVLQSCRRPDDRGPAVDLNDLFDLTLYVDAEFDDLRRWYVARLRTLLRTARGNPPAHLRRYACLSAAEIAEEATRRYREINEVNLVENIQPTRERADVIVRKGSDHAVREVLVRGSGDATTSAAASALPAVVTARTARAAAGTQVSSCRASVR
nr:type I pantothenate kinase [Frankia sp. ArI3]